MARDEIRDNFPTANTANKKAELFKDEILLELLADQSLRIFEECKLLNEDPDYDRIVIRFDRVKHNTNHLRILSQFLISKGYKTSASFETLRLDIELK